MLRAEHLSGEMNRSDLWDNPECAARVSREHGMCMGKIKEVKAFERELLEHVEMQKLARDEGDEALELVGINTSLWLSCEPYCYFFARCHIWNLYSLAWDHALDDECFEVDC